MKRALLTVILAGCGSAYPLDDLLRMDHVQAKATHNSYHLEPPELFDPSHAYSHAPLAEQLETQQVRAFELDLHRSVAGHFEVFHITGGVDEATTCRRLLHCLEEIRGWSEAHPDHFPITIWLEPKDEDLDWADENYDLFVGDYDQLETEIRSVFEDPITPDEVRGDAASLGDAIRNRGWPTLGEVRGRVLFAMLDGENHRAAYLDGAPDLAGRLMFVASATTSAPHAAVFKINNAAAASDRVSRLVEAGFMVTSNVDGVEQSDEANQRRLDGSVSAGAHFLATDLPAVDPARAYWADVPLRCNPVSAPPECAADLLE